MPRVLQSFIQGTAGSRDHGNFEAVIMETVIVRRDDRDERVDKLVHWFRENFDDGDDFFPWRPGATIVPAHVTGPGSIIQSNFGTGDVRNFEVIVPVRQGERTVLKSFSRNNAAQTPWQPAGDVTSAEDDVAGAAALIQSNFGSNGNFEAVVPLKKGPRVELWHFFRNNDDPAFPWRAGARVTGPEDDVLWGASLIQSNFGPRDRGNFEVAVPLRAANGKVELWHFFMDSATLQWKRGSRISADVSGPGVLIQSDFGDRDHGNFEAVVPEHDRLVHYFLDNERPGQTWRRVAIITEGLDGWGSIIQGNFGINDEHGNFEVLVDEPNGSVVHYYKSHERSEWPWVRTAPVIRQPSGVRLPNTQWLAQLTGEHDRSVARADGDQSFRCPHPPPLAFNQTETKFGLLGTDLGVSFEHDGKTFFLFGDSWRKNQPREITNFDAIAFTTDAMPHPGLPPAQLGLTLTFLPNPPVIVPAVAQHDFNVPLDGVSVDGAMFVFFSTDRMKVEDVRPLMGKAVLTHSTDGQRFDMLYVFSATKFVNVSVVRTKLRADEARELGLADPDVLLIWGSGRWRSSAVYLAVLPIGGLLTREGLRFYAGRHGRFAWSDNEEDATALFPEGCVGELSVRWNPFLRRYLMMYQGDNPDGIILHTAKKPWGPWSPAPITVFDRSMGFGKFIHRDWRQQKLDCTHDSFFDRDKGRPAEEIDGAAYGPYQIANMAKGDASGTFTELFFTMSTWNPYQVMLMTTRVEEVMLNTPPEALSLAHANARRFLTQSNVLSASGQADAAVGEARGAVDVLRDLDPARASEVDHLLLLAAAQHTLARRLVEAGRIDPALQPAADTIATYRLAAEAGADAADVAGQLFNLNTLLASVSRLDAAMEVLRGAIDILRAATPAPDQLARHLTLLGVGLQTLAVHLIAANRVDEAVPHARDAIATYRRAAAAGGDRDAIGGQLLNLSNALAAAGQPDAAAEAAQAAVDVLGGPTPS